MSFDTLSDLFRQIRPKYRWALILVWNGLAIGGAIATGGAAAPLEDPIPLTFFTLAGLVLVFVAFGLLLSLRVREAMLLPGHSLEGYRFLLACVGFGGLLISAGAAMVLIAIS